MEAWVFTQWKPILGYTPKVSHLLNQWYRFHLLHHADVEKIMGTPCVSGRCFLQLKQWYVGFNLVRDIPQNKYIWVKLPGFPLEFWTGSALEVIGNTMGKFIYMDLRVLGLETSRSLGFWWRWIMWED